jgi:hypothetical protein
LAVHGHEQGPLQRRSRQLRRVPAGEASNPPSSLISSSKQNKNVLEII